MVCGGKDQHAVLKIIIFTFDELWRFLHNLMISESGKYLYRCTVRYKFPYLIDLFIGDGYAAESPVMQGVSCPDPTVFPANAMDIDIAAGIDTELLGMGPVCGIWIRDMQ